MKKIVLPVSFILLLLTTAEVRAEEKRMNVLFLVSDDLNSWLLGDTARYAGKVVAPNLTKLAEGGVNFRRAYTASPVCSPSRTAFMSGVAPWKSGSAAGSTATFSALSPFAPYRSQPL